MDRALTGRRLTVYEPGTQAWNFLHVKDIARLFANSAEVLVDQIEPGETGARSMAVGSDDTLSVMDVAEIVQERAHDVGRNVDIELVENPRSDETLVEDFAVDASVARETLGWQPRETVAETFAGLLDSV